MKDKKLSSMYVAFLYLRGRGIVDLIETHDELRALEAFDGLIDEANLDTFGEGIYKVSLNKEWFDEKGRFINGKILKKIIIERGDEL